MYFIVKRMIDILISITLLFVLLPIFIIIAVGVKIDSKGKVIFKHKRFGKDLKPIYVYKFRTMVENAEKIGPQYTIAGDMRITKFGAILRKLSLDELPQILNILKGEMSIIGPRPDAYEETYTQHQKIRCSVLPGLTGLSQVNGRSNLTADEKEKFDEKYVEELSFKLDCIIFLKTIKVVLSGKDIT